MPHSLAGSRDTQCSLRGNPNGGAPAMLLPINDFCPKCGAPVVFVSIQKAPGRRDLALRTYHCPNCGSVEMTPIRLASDKAEHKK
jgi:ribosomal protein S27AE